METALEYILANTYKKDMMAYMDAHPESFEELVILAISDKQPYAWRAAWLMWSCMKENDTRIQKYIKDIINSLPNKNEDHMRELIKILLNVELNKAYEGILFDLCVSIWEKIQTKPSIRFSAFKMIIKIAKKHPDLSNEIKFLIQDQYMDSLSPVVKRSITKMIKELEINKKSNQGEYKNKSEI